GCCLGAAAGPRAGGKAALLATRTAGRPGRWRRQRGRSASESVAGGGVVRRRAAVLRRRQRGGGAVGGLVGAAGLPGRGGGLGRVATGGVGQPRHGRHRRGAPGLRRARRATAFAGLGRGRLVGSRLLGGDGGGVGGVGSRVPAGAPRANRGAGGRSHHLGGAAQVGSGRCVVPRCRAR